MIEDDESILAANRALLTRDGYMVHDAATMADARRALHGLKSLDLVLLDLALPDGDGMELVNDIRMAGDAAILMLTSKRKYDDIVSGLTGGADEYMTKPFFYPELKARIDALLTKRKQKHVLVTSAVSVGPLSLDVVALRASVKGVDLLLTGKEFALLLVLTQNVGNIVSAETLYRSVWKAPLGRNSNALWMQISRLKRKIEAQNNALSLTTARGNGYMLEMVDR